MEKGTALFIDCRCHHRILVLLSTLVCIVSLGVSPVHSKPTLTIDERRAIDYMLNGENQHLTEEYKQVTDTLAAIEQEMVSESLQADMGVPVDRREEVSASIEEQDGHMENIPVIDGQEAFQKVIVRAAENLNESQAEEVLIEEVNMTLGSLNATLHNGNVSNTSIDDPAILALQKNNRESQDAVMVERNKEHHLFNIKAHVLQQLTKLGHKPPVNHTAPNSHQMEIMREMFEKMKQDHDLARADVYTEKFQSFYPSCDLPRNTEKESWSDADSMNLLFELSYPVSLDDTSVNIISARLRLYKLSQGNRTVSEVTCLPASETTVDPELPSNQSHSPPIIDDDRQIRVSVYWYTRSLRKHRVKRKLLDSKMLSVYGEEWTEFNVRPAARMWRESGRNFGLVVEVEDEDGVVLPATDYFSAMNCSNEASTARPIPGFLLEAFRNLLKNPTYADNENKTANSSNDRSEVGAATNHINAIYIGAFMFPMMDLCTVQVPKEEVADDLAFFHQATYVIARHLANLTSAADDSSNPTNQTSQDDPTQWNKASGDSSNATVVKTSVDNALQLPPTNIRHRGRHAGHRVHQNARPQGDVQEEVVREEDITMADENGHKLREKIIVKKIFWSANHHRANGEASSNR